MNDPLGLFEEEKGSDPLGLFDEEIKKPSFMDKAIGVGETALSFGTGMVAQVPAAIGAAVSGVNDLTQGRVPASVVPTFEGITRGLTYEPRTAEGKDMLDDFSRSGAMQSLNAVGGHVIPPVLTKPRMPKVREEVRPVDVSVLKQPEAIPVKDPLGLFDPGARAMENIVESQTTGWNEPVRNNGTGNGLDTVLQQSEAARHSDAQAQIEARQRAIEFEVQRQTALDQGAAERGRQGQAGTGYGDWQAQRAAEEAAATHDYTRQLKQVEIDDMPQGYHADQYGGGQDGLRIDENGMPIRADRSMEAANLENPLQRNLWGDELPRQSAQEATRGITAAIDRMPPGEARQAGIDMLSNGRRRAESGALNMDVFDPAFEKVKEIADGIRLVMKGRREGPVVIAVDRNGKKVGEAAFSHNTFARPPKPTDSLEAGWVTTDPKKMSGGADGARMAPTTPSEYKGISAEMYKFAAENGNDIVPSGAQTPEGMAMWKKFEQRGLSQGMKIPRSQRGGIDIKAVEEGIKKMAGRLPSETMKNSPLVPHVPAKNSMETPTLPATIEKKNELRTKVDASTLLKKLAPEYSSVTTPEEAIHLSKDAEDIGHVPGVDNFRNATISGINGMTFLKPTNPLFNYVRYVRQTWENTGTKFSRDFVTGEEGFATLGRKLSKQDRMQSMQVLKDAAVAGINITPENIAKLGLSKAAEGFVLSVRRTMNEIDYMRGDAMLSTGRDPAKSLDGYLPAIWQGAYTGIIRNDKGRVIAMPQSDTYLGYRNAVKSYMKDNPGATEIKFPRKGLNSMQVQNNLFSGLNDVMNVLAKNDPEMAKIQAAAQMRINDATHKVMGFEVHELNKAGVKGSMGDRAHVSPERNANDLFKALIDYAEQAGVYYPMQKGMQDIGRVMVSEELAHMPNSKAVVEQYLGHLKGQSLNPIGVMLNWTLDALPKAVGVSSKVPLDWLRGLKTAVGIHMMGIYNPTFTALQLTQIFTGAMPELFKAGSKLHLDVTKSATVAPIQYTLLKSADLAGMSPPVAIPAHMKAGYQYAKDHGIMTFSELENAKSATRNRGVVAAEKAGAIWISAGEALTRPPVFMTFVDMFHRFGLPEAEANMAAHHVTNMAMGDYTRGERPQIYSQLGVVGEFGGALTTYKHNALTNLYIRGRDVATPDANGKRMYKAGMAAAGTAAMLYGITGMPGYEELDALYQEIMGQSIRETALKALPEGAKSGLLSATTGLDFQSRTSMSRILPEFKAGSLSPQLGVLVDMISKAATYSTYQDEQSRIDFLRSITPSGAKGMTEDALMVDKKGYVENAAGQLMPPEPRTDKERLIRKLFAIRPLRESIESKDIYSDSKKMIKDEQAQQVISKRFKEAFARGDQTGMDTLAQLYYDKNGDVSTLMNPEALKEQIAKMNQSQRERMTGKLSATMKSLNRYREMNDGN